MLTRTNCLSKFTGHFHDDISASSWNNCETIEVEAASELSRLITRDHLEEEFVVLSKS